MLRERLEHYIEGLEIDIKRLDKKDTNIVKNLIDVSDASVLKDVIDDLEKILEGWK